MVSICDKIQALAVGESVRVKASGRMDVPHDLVGFWTDQLDPINAAATSVAEHGKRYRCTGESDRVVLIERIE